MKRILGLLSILFLVCCGCAPEKPLSYNPPSSKIHGLRLLSGHIVGLQIGQWDDDFVRRYIHHQRPAYTIVIFEDGKEVRFCGDVMGFHALRLDSNVKLIVEDSDQSDYDGCYGGWSDMSLVVQK